MIWPFTLLSRPKPQPTPDDVRREHLRAAQFDLLEAQAHAEHWAYRVDLLTTRCARLEVGE